MDDKKLLTIANIELKVVKEAGGYPYFPAHAILSRRETEDGIVVVLDAGIHGCPQFTIPAEALKAKPAPRKRAPAKPKPKG
jgi:hypothetical protein